MKLEFSQKIFEISTGPDHARRQSTYLAWQIPIACIQYWDTPDGGQWTFRKHVEYFIKHIWERMYLVDFHYKNISRYTVLWMSKSAWPFPVKVACSWKFKKKTSAPVRLNVPASCLIWHIHCQEAGAVPDGFPNTPLLTWSVTHRL